MNFKAHYLQDYGYKKDTPIMPTNKHFYQALKNNEKVKVKSLNKSNKKK